MTGKPDLFAQSGMVPGGGQEPERDPEQPQFAPGAYAVYCSLYGKHGQNLLDIIAKDAARPDPMDEGYLLATGEMLDHDKEPDTAPPADLGADLGNEDHTGLQQNVFAQTALPVGAPIIINGETIGWTKLAVAPGSIIAVLVKETGRIIPMDTLVTTEDPNAPDPSEAPEDPQDAPEGSATDDGDGKADDQGAASQDGQAPESRQATVTVGAGGDVDKLEDGVGVVDVYQQGAELAQAIRNHDRKIEVQKSALSELKKEREALVLRMVSLYQPMPLFDGTEAPADAAPVDEGLAAAVVGGPDPEDIGPCVWCGRVPENHEDLECYVIDGQDACSDCITAAGGVCEAGVMTTKPTQPLAVKMLAPLHLTAMEAGAAMDARGLPMDPAKVATFCAALKFTRKTIQTEAEEAITEHGLGWFAQGIILQGETDDKGRHTAPQVRAAVDWIASTKAELDVQQEGTDTTPEE